MTDHQLIYAWLACEFLTEYDPPLMSTGVLSAGRHEESLFRLTLWHGSTMLATRGRNVHTVTIRPEEFMTSVAEKYWLAEIEQAVRVVIALQNKGSAQQPTGRKPH